ncbi:MAG TPA: O-antigen ligase family protein [Thermoleophilaceae bacterium]
MAFGGKGGSDLGRNTWVEIGLVVAAGLVIAAAVAYGPTRRLDGGASLLFFGALAALTALSVLWSIVPDATWSEANRTLAYLAVFAAGMGIARLAPGWWRVLLWSLLLAATAVIVYALASRVFPGSIAPDELYARIGQPFGYWNAVGVTAAIAVPPGLWLGARRAGYAPANALAYPLLGLMFVALFLSYSRGALAATIVALGLWFLFVPLRLRSLGVLIVSALGATPVIVWALSKDAFTKDLVPLATKESVAGTFGLLLLVMVAVLLAIGLAASFGLGVRAPSPRFRRRIGLAAAVVACAIPLVGLTSVAFSQKGFTGTISDKWSQATSESAKTSGGPGRLTQTSSSRGRYWRQAGHIFADHPLGGTGAGTFGTARLRYRNDVLVARHAHGFFAQTMADLGVGGLAVVVAFAIAWLWAAARTLGIRISWRPWRRNANAPPREPLRWDAERVGLAAITLAALAFGLHSAIDWTWFVPGPAVMAILAAGFVAGRGPVVEAAAVPAGGPRLSLVGDGAAPPAGRRLRVPSPQRVAFALVALAAAGLIVWQTAQPERSDSQTQDAISLAASGKLTPAVTKAKAAAATDPLSPKPLLVEAAVLDAAGHPKEAKSTLEQAVIRFPSQPQVWLRLADYDLHRAGDLPGATNALSGVLFLDPLNEQARELFLEARARQRGQKPGATAPAPPPPAAEQAPAPGE